jgi:fructokinase
MKKIICFGELLVDWLPCGMQTVAKLQIPLYAQYPGGAPANVSVACRRLGGDSYFVGQVGDDPMGNYLKNCLQTYQVNSQYLSQSPHPTAMAFVHLDEKGERSFTFKRHNSADLNYPKENFNAQMFAECGIFHICSNTLTETKINDCSLHAMQTAQQNGVLTSFDVNLRLMLWQNIKEVTPRVMQIMQHSDLVKLSIEELDFLRAEQSEGSFIDSLFALGVQLVLVTDGANPVHFYSRQHQQSIMTLQVTMVDSTGAGDAFTGGLLYSLAAQGISSSKALKNALQSKLPLLNAINIAICCGAYAVTQKGAWSALPTLDDINSLLVTIEKV